MGGGAGGSGTGSARRRVVDRLAEDRALVLRRVGDPSVIGQPLQPPALAQLPMMLATQQGHGLDVGPPAQRPGHLVVTLGPLRGPIAAWGPDAVPVPLRQRL